MIVAVSYYPERRATLPNDWAVWATTTPIPETYATLARIAYEEEWGLGRVVTQDDVRFTALPDSDAELVVYGQTSGPHHVCPRAFAATPKVWRQLHKRWRGGQVCEAWMPIVYGHGEILDVTTHG